MGGLRLRFDIQLVTSFSEYLEAHQASSYGDKKENMNTPQLPWSNKYLIAVNYNRT
jgi:hypothetical protein